MTVFLQMHSQSAITSHASRKGVNLWLQFALASYYKPNQPINQSQQRTDIIKSVITCYVNIIKYMSIYQYHMLHIESIFTYLTSKRYMLEKLYYNNTFFQWCVYRLHVFFFFKSTFKKIKNPCCKY